MRPDKRGPDAASKPPYKRRKVVVKRAFQFKFALTMFLLFGVAAFMVWWEVYSTFDAVVKQGLVVNPAAGRMVAEMSRAVLWKVLIALSIVWFLSILLSHYLAGPMYRLEACLKLLKEGDLVHRARLRRHDEMQSLADAYNEGVEAMQNRVKAIKDAARGGSGSLDRVRAIADEFKV